MKIYIAGPIRGKKDRNLPAFRAEQNFLRALGHEAVVPHDIPVIPHDGPCPIGYDEFEGHTSACYLRSDIRELLTCDAIKLLEGWEKSHGVTQVEYPVARNCGIQIFHPEEIPNAAHTPSPAAASSERDAWLADAESYVRRAIGENTNAVDGNGPARKTAYALTALSILELRKAKEQK